MYLSSVSVLGALCCPWRRQLPEGPGMTFVYEWKAAEPARAGSGWVSRGHEEIQSVCGCPCALMHTDRNEETRDQLLDT